MKFETSSKPVAKATKTKTIIYADGVEIGSRTSARAYKFALVVTGNQEHAIRSMRAGIRYQRGLAEKYAALANSEPGAIQGELNQRYGYSTIKGWIEDGQYGRWAAEAIAEVKRMEEALARYLSGPQPEFSKLVVASWHSRRDLVPDAKPWQKFVAVVEII